MTCVASLMLVLPWLIWVALFVAFGDVTYLVFAIGYPWVIFAETKACKRLRIEVSV